MYIYFKFTNDYNIYISVSITYKKYSYFIDKIIY